jgi:hypothetical protein
MTEKESAAPAPVDWCPQWTTGSCGREYVVQLAGWKRGAV